MLKYKHITEFFRQVGEKRLNFSCFCRHLLTFFKIYFFKKFFQEHYQSVKWFGSRLGLTFFRSVLVWVQTVCKDYQQMTKSRLKVLENLLFPELVGSNLYLADAVMSSN